MRITQIIPLIICGVVLITSVLIPVISESSDGDKTLDVVILAGQSNAAYRYGTGSVDIDEVNEEVPRPVGRCYYFGEASRPVYYGANVAACSIRSMTNSAGDWIIGNEEPSIASAISNYTKDDVLIINVAVSGWSITHFIPGQNGADYASEVIGEALSQIPSYYHVKKCGWVWIHGEANAGGQASEYVEQFKQVDQFYSDLGFESCYLVKTKASDSGTSRQAHNTILSTIPNVVLASDAPDTFTVENGCLNPSPDTIHYSQKGRDIVGNQVGEKICAALPTHARDSYGANALLGIVPIVILAGLGLLTIRTLILHRD